MKDDAQPTLAQRDERARDWENTEASSHKVYE
jgi:hypothetical protein